MKIDIKMVTDTLIFNCSQIVKQSNTKHIIHGLEDTLHGDKRSNKKHQVYIMMINL